MSGHAHALSLQNISVSFGGVRALSNVSLTADRGQVVGLVGPNGSGKTTLLNCASGFVKPEGGSVAVDGHDLTRSAPHTRAKHGLGRSLQNPRASRQLQVSDLLGSANRVRHGGNGFLEIARPFKAHRDQQARREEHKATLAEIGLDVALIDARIEDLSHGILKVIDIARSIQTATSVLLLDEPTSGLSQHELDLVGTLIRKASSSDAAVVVVEHNVQFLLGVADHVLVLHQGAELASGEPEATFNKPEVAAAYLGISI